METWDELDDGKDSDIEAEEANFALMAFTLSNSESESGFGFEYDEEYKDNFFSMLYGPCYPNLVNEFWVNAFIQDLHLEYAILSEVSGVPITPTPTSIVNLINYEEEGLVLNMHFLDSYLPFHLIFEDLSDISKVSNLNSKELVWYHMLISNFLPKNKDMTSLDIDGKSFYVASHLRSEDLPPSSYV
ncbi:hypothetical protein KIW84_011835 [Lathyrus oleraceus]|uniref:Uncharacterized protein n=1 Tax=Pisum sativum TaxID=3888 RepID=A0A9D5BFX9_PEA|nr:hypothetical protein KIW84_011835 [Pisum sativum]